MCSDPSCISRNGRQPSPRTDNNNTGRIVKSRPQHKRRWDQIQSHGRVQVPKCTYCARDRNKVCMTTLSKCYNHMYALPLEVVKDYDGNLYNY